MPAPQSWQGSLETNTSNQHVLQVPSLQDQKNHLYFQPFNYPVSMLTGNSKATGIGQWQQFSAYWANFALRALHSISAFVAHAATSRYCAVTPAT